MSEQVPVFIKKEDMPTAKEWARAIRSEGFGLELDTTWDKQKNRDGDYGYRSCSYYKLKNVGFELDIINRIDDPEYFEDFEEIDSNVKNFDLCVSFGIYREVDAMASEIARTILVKMAGDGIYFDLDQPIPINEALIICKEIDNEIRLKS